MQPAAIQSQENMMRIAKFLLWMLVSGATLVVVSDYDVQPNALANVIIAIPFLFAALNLFFIFVEYGDAE
jgi:hypothetical protein